MTRRSGASWKYRKNVVLCALSGTLAACGKVASHPAADTAFTRISHASAERPVVVEEFQSQGCSSCPPANANVNALADRPEVLALSYAVTYWDQLGWKDTFDQPAFTQRQWDYAHHAGRGNVATPQVIVNGTTAIVGSNRGELQEVLAREGSPTGGPTISANGGAVSIGAGRISQPATIWLVRYDPRVQWVSIRAGENDGRRLPHRGIVRELTEIGEWTGKSETFQLSPVREPALSSAILIQVGKGGPIIAARKL